MSRILFVYPNKEGYPIIPLGISVLSGILRYYGHETSLFDITFMIPDRFDHKSRERGGFVKKVDVQQYWGVDHVDINEEFKKKVLSFCPDLIAFSIVENNYLCAKRLIALTRQFSQAPIIVGGLFPTIAPAFFIEDGNVDLICVGEGEYAMIELAKRLDHNEDIMDIPNLIVKKESSITKNGFAQYYNWEPPIFQDWEIFDPRHMLKPFMGRMYRTGFFELSRGCPYNCSYCVNQLSQQIFRCLGRYNREKPIETAIGEMECLKDKYQLELIFFNDENFLTMEKERLKLFGDQYRARVSLPFFIMTRADSLLDEERIRILKEAGCVTIGIGVESGNERIRKELLNKNISNSIYEKAFANCRKYQLRTTANVIIGLPFETEASILESAGFCQKLKADSIAPSIYAPYIGSKLRDVCVKNGFIEDRYYEDIAVINRSVLTMPQISKDKIEELYYKFNDLVYQGVSEVR